MLGLLVLGCYDYGFSAEMFGGTLFLNVSLDSCSSYSQLGYRCCLSWCTKLVIWQAWRLHFCTLGAHRTIQGHENQKEHLGVKTLFVNIYADFKIPLCGSFVCHRAKIGVFLARLFPGHFLDNLGICVFKDKCLVLEVYFENMFYRG